MYTQNRAPSAGLARDCKADFAASTAVARVEWRHNWMQRLMSAYLQLAVFIFWVMRY